MSSMKGQSFCFYTISHLKKTAEVYGPTIALATKCAEALGGQNIQVVSSCENTVTFSLPQPDAAE